MKKKGGNTKGDCMVQQCFWCGKWRATDEDNVFSHWKDSSLMNPNQLGQAKRMVCDYCSEQIAARRKKPKNLSRVRENHEGYAEPM